MKPLFSISTFSTILLTMAAVHSPSIVAHPASFQTHNMPGSRMSFHPVLVQSTVSLTIPLMFIFTNFCPPPPQPKQLVVAQAGSKPNPYYSHMKLPYFVAYGLHHMKLHSSVTFTALVLLQWLKARLPTAQGSLGHHLFISAS